MEGFRLPLSRRGMRTTLVSGSQSLNEVETSPRHHVQRRALTVYPRLRRPVKLLFGHHRVQELPQCAEAGGHVLVIHVLVLAFLAEAKELLGHIQGGEGQDPGRVPAGGVAADLPGATVHEGRELADVLGRRLAPDRVLLAQDLDVDPLLLRHLNALFVFARLAFGSPRPASLTLPSPLRGAGKKGLLNVEPVELLEDAVHLGQHFLAFLPQTRELGTFSFRVLELGLQAHDLGLQVVALLAQPRDRLRGAAHRLFELFEPFRQPLGHPVLRHAPRTSARKRLAISATMRSCSRFTSASVRVRSGAWKVRLHARLRRPEPTWPPVYTSNRVMRVSRSMPSARMAASTSPAVTSPPTTTARSRWTAGNRGNGSYFATGIGRAASAVTESSATKTGPGRSNTSRAASATSPNQPTSSEPRTSRAARPGSRYAGTWSAGQRLVFASVTPAAWSASSASPLASWTSTRSRPPVNQARGARRPVSATPSRRSSCAGRSPSSGRCGEKTLPTSKSRASGICRLALIASTSRSPGTSEGRSTERSIEAGFCSVIKPAGSSQPMRFSRSGSRKLQVTHSKRPAAFSARLITRATRRPAGRLTGMISPPPAPRAPPAPPPPPGRPPPPPAPGGPRRRPRRAPPPPPATPPRSR